LERLTSFENHGQKLYGMLHFPEGPGPHPGVVLLHGFGGHRSESHFIFTKQARDLAQHGIAAFRFDFRGSGESEGEFSDVTIEGEISDAITALDYLSAQPEVEAARLGVLGLSMGGAVGACVAGRDVRVKALVLWSAPGKLLDVMTKEASSPHRSVSTLDDGFDIGGLIVGSGFVGDVFTVNPLEEIAKFTGPTLVIQGTADQSVPPENAQVFFDTVPGEKEIKWIEGADHVYSSIPWEREVINASTDWFVKHL
jgi:esterase/lipase